MVIREIMRIFQKYSWAFTVLRKRWWSCNMQFHFYFASVHVLDQCVLIKLLCCLYKSPIMIQLWFITHEAMCMRVNKQPTFPVCHWSTSIERFVCRINLFNIRSSTQNCEIAINVNVTIIASGNNNLLVNFIN